jgi:protoheme IX farnesyltransferase
LKTDSHDMRLDSRKFSLFSWSVLIYTVIVIVFGAFVRATGSGAGCGSHWPLCNGQVLPRSTQIETLIEFTHRATSGLTLLSVAALAIWAWRLYPSRSTIRWSSGLAVFFVLTEALIGAWLVLRGLVTTNDSVIRAVSTMVHLANTFLLLASLALTAWWSSAGTPEHLERRDARGAGLLGGAVLGILFLAASGAITALGDTLFPPATLLEGLRQDVSATTHYLLKLRVLHPVIACAVGFYLIAAMLWLKNRHTETRIQILIKVLFGLFACQLVLGFLNMMLLAPVWLQLLHLLMSTLIWIFLILLSASILAVDDIRSQASHAELP